MRRLYKEFAAALGTMVLAIIGLALFTGSRIFGGPVELLVLLGAAFVYASFRILYPVLHEESLRHELEILRARAQRENLP